MTTQKLAQIALRPKILHTLIGLTPCQFIVLLAELRPAWEAAEYKRKNWRGRQRKIGGGRIPNLDLAGDLFMTLLFYRTYVHHPFIGLIVGLDESNVGRRIRRLEPLLQQVFRIPERKINLTEDELWELIVDATEQETHKRKGSGYSGKKKRQTIKTQIHVNRRGEIKAVSSSIAGNRHDKHLYDISQTYCRGPDGTAVKVRTKSDLGYVGTECDTPIKKPKSRPLRMHEKYYNQKHAEERVEVEHQICHLKKWRCLNDRYRGAVGRYNLMFKNVAGLRNFIQTAPA
jgi:hypothetical protein